MKDEMQKTLTFSIREEERDRERKMLLRAVYDALSEKGYNPINQLVGYVLTEDPRTSRTTRTRAASSAGSTGMN